VVVAAAGAPVVAAVVALPLAGLLVELEPHAEMAIATTRPRPSPATLFRADPLLSAMLSSLSWVTRPVPGLEINYERHSKTDCRTSRASTTIAGG
jgi:hypothetical protein